MVKRFRMRKRIKPIFEKDILQSTNRLIRCYRCGFPHGTLVKHVGAGYCHQDPNLCIKNIKNKNLQKTMMRRLLEMAKRRKRIDYKIYMWFLKKWRMVWYFFRHKIAERKRR